MCAINTQGIVSYVLGGLHHMCYSYDMIVCYAVFLCQRSIFNEVIIVLFYVVGFKSNWLIQNAIEWLLPASLVPLKPCNSSVCQTPAHTLSHNMCSSRSCCLTISCKAICKPCPVLPAECTCGIRSGLAAEGALCQTSNGAHLLWEVNNLQYLYIPINNATYLIDTVLSCVSYVVFTFDSIWIHFYVSVVCASGV